MEYPVQHSVMRLFFVVETFYLAIFIYLFNGLITPDTT
jgi:hypothetical protein